LHFVTLQSVEMHMIIMWLGIGRKSFVSTEKNRGVRCKLQCATIISSKLSLLMLKYFIFNILQTLNLLNTLYEYLDLTVAGRFQPKRVVSSFTIDAVITVT
jgi:hypothetical protein